MDEIINGIDTLHCFSQCFSVQHVSLQNLKSPHLFDLIVCNPPFFENSLLPPKAERKMARHSHSLPFLDLMKLSKSWLAQNGTLALITPVAEGYRLMGMALDSGLFLSRQCAVFSKSSKPQERWMMEFKRMPVKNLIQSSLILMDAKGTRTQVYRSLTEVFYLNSWIKGFPAFLEPLVTFYSLKIK